MIDYNKAWADLMSNKSSHDNPYKDKYETALAYDNSKQIWEDGNDRADKFVFPYESSVLDIGSGPGVLTIPLAKRVKTVTAIDPSPFMVSLLKKHCVEEELLNVQTIQSCWEDVPNEMINGYDYVIASYSLAMPDISSSLIKMNNAARKKVILFWFSGTPSWDQLKIDLYPIIHKTEFLPGPKSDILYGVLGEMGISPDVKLLKGTSFNHIFDSMEQAVHNMRGRLDVEGSEYDNIFEAYITSHYEKMGEKWRFMDNTNYVEISWDVQGDL